MCSCRFGRCYGLAIRRVFTVSFMDNTFSVVGTFCWCNYRCYDFSWELVQGGRTGHRHGRTWSFLGCRGIFRATYFRGCYGHMESIRTASDTSDRLRDFFCDHPFSQVLQTAKNEKVLERNNIGLRFSCKLIT